MGQIFKDKKNIIVLILSIAVIVFCINISNGTKNDLENTIAELNSQILGKDNEITVLKNKNKELEEENDSLKTENQKLNLKVEEQNKEAEESKESKESTSQNSKGNTTQTNDKISSTNVKEPEVVQNTNTSIVYITKTGKKYHKDGCSYLKNSKIEISLDKAINDGYTACSKCY